MVEPAIKIDPPPIKNGKKAFAITSFIILGITLICLLYYFLYARFHVYTNDAYVNGNQVVVTPQVRGIVTSITMDNTQLVEKGMLLISLDKNDASLELKKREDELAESVRNVAQMFEKVKELESSVAMQTAEFIKSEQDYAHRIALIDQAAVSIEDLEHAKAALDATEASLEMTQSQLLSAKAQIENTTITTHPLIEKAKDNLRQAYLALVRCDIFAPATGIIAQRGVQVGEWVNPGDSLLAIIPLDQIWVDANYKETQLKNLRIGQRASVHADMYGRNVEFHGTLVGQNAGTGSVFSILPPQNATGNWIKIVQRIPVRIALDPKEVQKHPLWLGLSMEVDVDIRETDGPIVPNVSNPQAPLYSTSIFADQLKGSEELIQKVIEENISKEIAQGFTKANISADTAIIEK